MVDNTYISKTYRKQGGDESVVASGGKINIESGGIIEIDGEVVTPTAAELNKLAGSGSTVASGTQQAYVADPTGGTTVDAEARTAINAILDALEAFEINAAV